MKRVRTEALLPFPPEAVWDVLADFEAYEEWNPLNLRARGRAEPGAKVAMTFINPARPGTTIDQVVTVTDCRRGDILAWEGRVPLLFSGRHSFVLRPEGPGTRLIHGEDMSGLIALTFSARILSERFVPAYEACNAALAGRLAFCNGGGHPKDGG
jgi:hypothetical protein